MVNPLIRKPAKSYKTFNSNKSHGILDDHAVRKVLQTQEIQTEDLVLTDTVWDDQQVQLGSVGFGSSAPTWTDFKGGEVLSFDKAQDNKIFFTMQMSHRLKQNTPIEFHLHTSAPANEASGNVKWVLTVSFADINGTFPDETTYEVLQSCDGTCGFAHHLKEISDDIAESSNLSGIAVCSLMREGTDATDTFTEDIYLLALDAHFEIDTMGSREEMLK